MELQQDSIIVSDRLQALFDFELRNCFTHAFVTDGECAMKYSGEEVRMEKGDCVIIIANHLVTEIQPTENFRAKVIFIEPGFMEACTPHTSYGIVGGMTLFIIIDRDSWYFFKEVVWIGANHLVSVCDVYKPTEGGPISSDRVDEHRLASP